MKTVAPRLKGRKKDKTLLLPAHEFSGQCSISAQKASKLLAGIPKFIEKHVTKVEDIRTHQCSPLKVTPIKEGVLLKTTHERNGKVWWPHDLEDTLKKQK